VSANPAAAAEPPRLDHLVVAAATLEQGVRWCEGVLGVTPGPGGRHALMGTHNRLLRLEGRGFPGAYLEIIAIDPQAAPPGRARWFGLDARPASAAPALVHWVMRCDDVERRRAALRALGSDPGVPVAAGRATPGGELRWRITLRDDGVPQASGALPSLIQWDGPHPTAAMGAGGVALESLAIGPLPRDVRACLAVPGLGDTPGAGLRATLLTPRGRIVLDSAGPGAGTGRGAQP
jgi:hypothetical protein